MVRRIVWRAIGLFLLCIFMMAVGAVGVAKGAPLLADLTTDTKITFTTPGQDLGRDIVTTDNLGGLRIYGCPTLTTTPDCAAIQFFGNGSSGFPGQAFVDSGANNNAAVIFRTARTSTDITERMRVNAQGNVGVGTSTPGEKLTVKGNSRILGDDNPVARGFTLTNITQPVAVAVSGKYAYVTTVIGHRLAIFDVSDPDNIVAKGFTSTNLFGPFAVAVAGRYAYVASKANHTLAIFDVSDPNNIVAKGTTTANLQDPIALAVSGRYAYVTNQTNDRLAIFDVTDPNNIVAKGISSTNLDEPVSIAVAGHYAYIASATNNRLAIFDVANPNTIVAKGFLGTNLSRPSGVYISGPYAYVASQLNNSLVIFDVSDPDTIVFKSATTTNLSDPLSVHVDGKYAYVNSFSNSRLAVFDVSTPSAIVAKGFTSTNLSSPNMATVSGRFAYVASTSNNQLAIFELNNLDTPTLDAGAVQTGTFDVLDNAIVNNDLYVQGGLNVGPQGAHIEGDVSIGGQENSGDKLFVLGDVRVGTAGTNGCVKNFSATALVGTCVSDLALKKDLEPLSPVLDKLAAIQPYSYLWRSDEYPELNLGSDRTYGLIAQQIEQAFPELVATDEQGRKLVHYHLLPLFLAQGMRELADGDRAQKAEISSLQREFADYRQDSIGLEERLAALERLIGTSP